MCVCVRARTLVRVDVFVSLCTCMHVRLCLRMFVTMFVCTCEVCLCVRIHVCCLLLHISTHSHAESFLGIPGCLGGSGSNLGSAAQPGLLVILALHSCTARALGRGISTHMEGEHTPPSTRLSL